MKATESLSKILKTLMYYKNKRPIDIVNHTSIPRPTVYKIVMGDTKNPKPKYISELANYFDVTTEQLRGLLPINWDNFPSSNKTLFSRTKQIPVYLWKKENEWMAEILASGETRYVTTTKHVGEKTFALEIKDSSMEPLFNKGAIIIVDPDFPPKNGAYVVVKIQHVIEVICRQLVIDIETKYLKPTNSNNDIYKTRKLGKNDLILGVVVQALIDFEYE